MIIINIILASKSPRRREILENLNISFTVVTAQTDESSNTENPEKLVEELALRKASAVKQQLISEGSHTKDTVIIGCDTVVVKDGIVLGKPKDRQEATEMLKMLSDSSHSVISGLALIKGDDVFCSHETTTVYFDKLTDSEIASYTATGECDDKAGAYGIQGLASKFIKGIKGCYFNVVGLPVNLLYNSFKYMNIIDVL